MQLRHVESRTGVRWLREGFFTFMRQPVVPFVLVMAYLLPVHLLSLVSPALSRAFEGALAPAMTLALMAATASLLQAGTSTRQVFLSALQATRTRIRPLAVLGLMHGAALLLAGKAALAFAGALASDTADLSTTIPGSAASPTVVTGLLFYYLLRSLVILMFWHAPGLVHWHGVAPVKSLFFSTVTCLRNLGAMAVLGLAWGAGLAALVAWMSFVTTKTATPLAGPIDMLAGKMAVFVVVVVLEAVVHTAVWFSFKDCLRARGADGAAAE
ncbi:BPSS1780 family membrane protein [Variovorax sp. J22G21]|uniref:BPSS1780 family membrane protein n=1 Tax=Variovorax fucosicus TaxID=3053517 RepID=UPI002575EAF0|nr:MULTISPECIES: BPSS1780 family membrane protein [unclassified Variovorax]MDM0038261.1 BPSS1780 family membrane protein [Variovorax sp. J22R193]MDM0063037.1 BPSS1780 family membrane protein [Variovorax sp. J22G21]